MVGGGAASGQATSVWQGNWHLRIGAKCSPHQISPFQISHVPNTCLPRLPIQHCLSQNCPCLGSTLGVHGDGLMCTWLPCLADSSPSPETSSSPTPYPSASPSAGPSPTPRPSASASMRHAGPDWVPASAPCLSSVVLMRTTRCSGSPGHMPHGPHHQ